MSGIKPIVAQIARYIMAALIGWGLIKDLIKDGETAHNKAVSVVAYVCEVLLLAAGGFWG